MEEVQEQEKQYVFGEKEVDQKHFLTVNGQVAYLPNQQPINATSDQNVIERCNEARNDLMEEMMDPMCRPSRRRHKNVECAGLFHYQRSRYVFVCDGVPYTRETDPELDKKIWVRCQPVEIEPTDLLNNQFLDRIIATEKFDQCMNNPDMKKSILLSDLEMLTENINMIMCKQKAEMMAEQSAQQTPVTTTALEREM